MKKAVCIILLLLVSLNFAATAYADGEQNEPGSGNGNQSIIVPNFTVTYSNLPEGISVPSNEVSFLCEPVSGHPNPEDLMLSFGMPSVNGTVITVPFVFPEYTVKGEYRYRITQDPGSLIGVTYDSVPFVFCVLVGYEDDGSIGVLESGAGTNGISEGKKIGFENSYSTGSLNVTNTVEGNFGDKEKYFTITVTFSIPEEKNIESTITYSEPGGSQQTITADDWSTGTSSSRTVSVTIHLKNSQTAVFSNVPAGVSYTILPMQEDGYMQTVSPGPGAISANSSASAGITNKMDGSLDAGIVYRSTGYILVFTFSIIGLVLLFRGNRNRGEKRE